MDTFEEESPGLLHVVGKYMCFFAFSVLLFSIPALGIALQRVMWNPRDRDFVEPMIYLAALVVGAACVFVTGILFVYRRPVWGVLVLIAAYVAAVWILPDR